MYIWDIKTLIYDFRTEAKHFTLDRFLKAFPERKPIQVFESPKEIFARLSVLLRPPYKMGCFDCVWWTQGIKDSNVNCFIKNEKENILHIGELECNIKKIISLDFDTDYKNCVYVEINPLEPIFTKKGQEAPRRIEDEEFAIYDGKIISTEIAGSGCYWENNELKTIDRDKIIYCCRFLTENNFLLLSRQNSVIQCADKYELNGLLDDILCNHKTIYDLYDFIMALGKPKFYCMC